MSSVFTGVGKFLELIKFSHTVFALPFALISLLVATGGKPGWETTLWIILAMVGARTGAMGFNRLVDRKWDAENPRTANRPSVTGEVSPALSTTIVILSYALLVFAAWNLNPLAFKLSPVAIFLVSFYSYTKRFTSLCHIFLGIAIGSAPIASWIAATGEISVASLFLGASVLTWIGGFDVLYALQDLDYDREASLHSIPAKFGVAKSLMITRGLHLATVAFWVLFAQAAQLSFVFYIGVVLSAGLLLWEHSLVKKDDLSKLNMAFFNMNAVISVTLFISLAAHLLYTLYL